jgi:adenine deaminase
VVAQTPEEALTACQALVETGGGLCYADNGEVTALLELPIAGLLSPLPVEKLAPRVAELKNTMNDMGLGGENPLLRVATLTLAVIPEAKLTDMGLVEVETQKLLPLFVEEE